MPRLGSEQITEGEEVTQVGEGGHLPGGGPTPTPGSQREVAGEAGQKGDP